MKILFLTPIYPPDVGGAASYFGEIAPRLLQRERVDRVTVLTECRSAGARLDPGSKVTVNRDLPSRVGADRSSRMFWISSYLKTQIWFALNFGRFHAAGGYDIIHIHCRIRGPFVNRALRQSRQFVVADLRDRLTDPAALASCARVVLCCGEAVERFAVERGVPAAMTRLVPVPIPDIEVPTDTETIEACRSAGVEGAPYLLFVGEVSRAKGVDILLGAFTTWKQKHPNYRLVIAGRSTGQFASDLRKSPGVTSLGQVDNPTALALMRGAEVVILPSRSEGLPQVILEALAVGTKVICPPGIPEFDRHLSPFVLEEITIPCLLERLEHITSSSKMSDYPLEQHSIERVLDELVEVYDELGKPRPRA